MSYVVLRAKWIVSSEDLLSPWQTIYSGPIVGSAVWVTVALARGVLASCFQNATLLKIYTTLTHISQNTDVQSGHKPPLYW